MQGIMQKRIALFFVVLLFLLALVPAYYPAEDEALHGDSSFSKAYAQVFAAENTFYFLDHDFSLVETVPLPKTTGCLPIVLFSSSETRAPPA